GVDLPGRRSGSRRLAGALGKTSEGLGVVDGEVGEHLAVHLDAGDGEAVHHLRVAEAVDAGGGVDARDPQPAEVAVAIATVAVRVGVGLHQGLLGPLVAGVRLAAEPLRQRERRAALLARVDRALDTGHLTPSSRLTRCASCPEMAAGRPSARLRLGDFFSRMWLVKAWRPRTLPRAVTRKRFLAPECVFDLGTVAAPIMTRRRSPRGPSRRCARAARSPAWL